MYDDEYENKYTKHKYRNDYRKKIVFCGFEEIEKNSIPQFYSLGKYEEGDYFEPYRKAPIYEFVNSFEIALKKQGLLLVLKVPKDFNSISFDKKYRKKLNYWYIYYYNEDFPNEYERLKYSNLIRMDEQWLYADWSTCMDTEIDMYFKEHPKLKLHPKKKELLENIHTYIKPKTEISSKEIAEHFNISIRNVQRYMNDINIIYNDIGYDYSKNIWYICK